MDDLVIRILVGLFAMSVVGALVALVYWHFRPTPSSERYHIFFAVAEEDGMQQPVYRVGEVTGTETTPGLLIGGLLNDWLLATGAGYSDLAEAQRAAREIEQQHRTDLTNARQTGSEPSELHPYHVDPPRGFFGG